MSKSKIKELFKRYLLLIIGSSVLVVASGLYIYNIYAANYYRSDPNTTIEVNRYLIKNTGPKSYFIPTKTTAEFNSFRDAAAAGKLTGISICNLDAYYSTGCPSQYSECRPTNTNYRYTAMTTFLDNRAAGDTVCQNAFGSGWYWAESRVMGAGIGESGETMRTLAWTGMKNYGAPYCRAKYGSLYYYYRVYARGTDSTYSINYEYKPTLNVHIVDEDWGQASPNKVDVSFHCSTENHDSCNEQGCQYTPLLCCRP